MTTRFVSPDPLFAVDMEKCIESIIECNLYQYTGNNPVSYIDPSGEFIQFVAAAALVYFGSVNSAQAPTSNEAGAIKDDGGPMNVISTISEVAGAIPGGLAVKGGIKGIVEIAGSINKISSGAEMTDRIVNSENPMGEVGEILTEKGVSSVLGAKVEVLREGTGVGKLLPENIQTASYGELAAEGIVDNIKSEVQSRASAMVSNMIDPQATQPEGNNQGVVNE